MRIIRNITSNECAYPLDFSNRTRHFMERANRLTRTGMGVGKVLAGFLVDKGHENGLEEHYITTTGLIIIRNHMTHKAITILIARKAQIRRYYDAIRINMLKPEYMYPEKNPLSKEEKVNLLSVLQREALDAMGNPTMGETNWEYLIRMTNEMMDCNYPLDLPIPDYTKLPGGE